MILQNHMTIEQKIEAVLFALGEPMSVKKLSTLLEVPVDDVLAGLNNLEQSLAERGLCITKNEDKVALGTRSELSALIEKIYKDELNKELTKASIETISIIVYKGGATRSEVDYVRGVNSSFIIRNLLVRGLVEKVPHPTDSRKFLYKPTFELLSYLGVTKLEELSEYEKTKEILEAREAGMKEAEK